MSWRASMRNASGPRLLLDTNVLLDAVSPGRPQSAEECLMSAASDEPDFEDGMIRACAELNDVDFILTRYAAAYRRSTVRSMTCAEYLEVFPLKPLA